MSGRIESRRAAAQDGGHRLPEKQNKTIIKQTELMLLFGRAQACAIRRRKGDRVGPAGSQRIAAEITICGQKNRERKKKRHPSNRISYHCTTGVYIYILYKGRFSPAPKSQRQKTLFFWALRFKYIYLFIYLFLDLSRYIFYIYICICI